MGYWKIWKKTIQTIFLVKNTLTLLQPLGQQITTPHDRSQHWNTFTTQQLLYTRNPKSSQWTKYDKIYTSSTPNLYDPKTKSNTKRPKVACRSSIKSTTPQSIITDPPEKKSNLQNLLNGIQISKY